MAKADGQHAFAGLKIGNGLQTGFIGIAEIMPDSTVEMNIHQTGQSIGTVGIQNFLAFQRGRTKGNAA